MKTIFNLLLMMLFFAPLSVKAQTQAVPDANFRAVLKTKFPTLDTNNDDIITEAEIGTLNNHFFTNGHDMILHFTDSNVFTYDLTGIEFFECKIVKLYSDLTFTNTNPSGWVSINNFDLTKLKDRNGINCGSCGFIKELYLYRINADPNQLKIEAATNLLKVTAIESNGLDKLDKINKNDPTQSSIEDIWLEATDDFYTTNLDLTGVNSLKTLIVNRITLDTLKVASGNLTSITLYNITDLKMVGLPKTTPSEVGVYHTSKLQSLIVENTDGTIPFILPNVDLKDQLLLKGLTLKTNQYSTTLTTLDLSKNTELTYLKLEGQRGISTIDVTRNTKLTEIHFRYMHFSLGTGTVDFSNNIELLKLTCETTFINTLDISKNTKLTELRCSDNQLTSLDVSKSPDLVFLECPTNQITELNVSTNLKLERLLCDSNKIEKLDISNNSLLVQLNCNSNELKTLNVANGNNANMNSWEFNKNVNSLTNPNLTCIYVDANVINNIPDTWMKDATANYTLDDEISYVDLVFYDKLKNHNPVIDVDGNGKISNCEAENFTGKLDVSNGLTANLAGIEAFKNITELDCSNSNLTALNISSNTKLTTLYCQNNSITSINLTALTEIEIFNGSHNSLTTLLLGNNKTKLKNFDFSHNQLSGSYSTDGLSNLEAFICNDNQLQHIGVTLNTKLKYLLCQNNPFSSASAIDNIIDFSQNPELLVVNCSNNQLQDLDVSNNLLLTELYCKNNILKKLNIANGNNANLTGFDASGNNELSCIQVDASILNAIPNTWVKDAIANYASNCSLAVVDETLKNTIKLYPNPVINVLRISNQSNEEIKNVLIYTLLGKKVGESKTNFVRFADLKSGLYIVKIITVSNKMLLQKIMKE